MNREKELLQQIEELESRLERAGESELHARKLRRRLLSRLSNSARRTVFGATLHDAIRNVTEPLSRRESVPKTALGDLIAAIVGRFVRVGAIGVLLALIPQSLLIWQNMLIADQNAYLRVNNEFFLAQLSRERRDALEQFISSVRQQETLIVEDIDLYRSLEGRLEQRITNRDETLQNSNPAGMWYNVSARVRNFLMIHERVRELSPVIFEALEFFAEFKPRLISEQPITLSLYELDLDALDDARKVLGAAIEEEAVNLQNARVSALTRHDRFLEEWGGRIQ